MVITIEPGKLPADDTTLSEIDPFRDICAPVPPFPQGVPQHRDSD